MPSINVLAAALFALAIPDSTTTDGFNPAQVHALAEMKMRALPPAKAPIRLYSLVAVAEDTYFEALQVRAESIVAYLGTDMPIVACIRASRLINSYGGMTTCMAQVRPGQ